MVLTREDQPAAKVPVTHPVLTVLEEVLVVVPGVQAWGAPSLTLSAHQSWPTPNSRGPMLEATQLQLTC